MEWSDAATIGYNAGGEYNASHPLSGTLLANAVDCLHSNINVAVNNIIFDLVPGELNAGTTPPPPSSLGMLEICTVEMRFDTKCTPFAMTYRFMCRSWIL